jgi:hypothetical protein
MNQNQSNSYSKDGYPSKNTLAQSTSTPVLSNDRYSKFIQPRSKVNYGNNLYLESPDAQRISTGTT